MIYALITARGGSKGIKNKNLKKIGKLSLLEKTCRNIKNSNLFDKIFCSSDSLKILNISKKNKIFPIRRPNNISMDKSNSILAVYHFHNFLTKKKIELPEIVFLFQPTSPFIKVETINKMIKLYSKYPKTSSVISVYKVNNKYNYINQRTLNKKNEVKFLFETQRDKMVRRQDKPDVYVHGNLFSFKINQVLKQKKITPKPLKAVKLSSFYEAVDIDNYEDLEFAKIIEKHITL